MKSVILEGPAQRMSAFDAAFLYSEKPHSPLSIGCVAVLERSVSRDEFLRHLDRHLARIRRFSQRATPAPLALAHPAWVTDPQFDLRNHVHRLGIPHPGGDGELCEAVAELIGRPLARDRPLWEAVLLDGLCDDRTAVLHRVHHCMLDGVAGAGVLESLLDTEPSASGLQPRSGDDEPSDRGRTGVGGIGQALSESLAASWRRSRRALGLIQHPGRLRRGVDPAKQLSGWVLRSLLEPKSALPWNQPIGPRRCVAFAHFPLDLVRAIRAARGCTVNDVVLSVLAGGLHRYLGSVGIAPERQPLVAAVPVNVRTAAQGSALGNRLGVLLVPLMVGIEDEKERLDLTAALTGRLKQGHGHDAVAALLAAADLLPPPLVAWLGRHARIPSLVSVIATNVRGPASPRYLAGRRVEALYPIVPVADGLGLGLAVLSYAGTLYVGVNAAADCVPDLGKLRAGIEESMACLASAL